MNLKKNKIGILGGSFDQPHKGHLAISREAKKKLKLKKIIWAITNKNPFKKKSSLTLSSRIQYCEKIIKKTAFIEVKFLEKKIKSNKINRRFAMFVLKENKPGFPLLLHEEPIYLENKIIGKTTSGNYSFNYNKNISFGYVNTEISNDELKDKKIYIEIEKQKYLAEVLFKPLKQSDYKLI